MFFIDTAYNSIIKHNEELCGDHVEQVNLPDSKILVLSDGLGSGVKANILATLTSKIAATMLKEGASLEDTIDTIVHTLPVCSERKLAYSTFTIIKVYNDGNVYAAEFDNPSIFLIKNGESKEIHKVKRVINDKIIYESNFTIDEESMIVAVSDGVVHAGVGKSLNLGWQRENVENYLKEISKNNVSTKATIRYVLNQCNTYYEGEAGDDTTVLAVKIRKQNTINLFTGPPKNPEEDFSVVNEILAAEGKVVVCGGTTANIMARILGCEIEIDVSTMTSTVPPVAILPRMELVTEGVITINKAIELITSYNNTMEMPRILPKLQERNAAAMLARLLIEDCDKLNLWVGQAINPAHQAESFPMGFNFKINQIKKLADLIEKMGKEVNIKYI